MKKILITLLAVPLAFAGCGDDGNNTDNDDNTPDGATTPAAPTLGAQLDRMGRPAVNTALNHTFDGDAVTTQAAKDAWNNAVDPSTWSSFAPEIAANLAIYDSLDTMCGNQILTGATAVAGRYNTLAGALADDRVYVNSAVGECTQYLAVEATATSLADLSANCGGRAPGYDVIDTTYSVLAAGIFTGVDDTITVDDAPASTTFPFLSAPTT